MAFSCSDAECRLCQSEVSEDILVLILCRQNGVCEIAINVTPLAESAIIKQFQFLGDDKWNDVVV